MLTYHKIGQGHHRVMIYIHIVGHEPLIDASCQVSLKSVHLFGGRRFFKGFTIYGHGSYLGHVTWIISSPEPKAHR